MLITLHLFLKELLMFLSEPGVREQPELVALLFAPHLFQLSIKVSPSGWAVTPDNFSVTLCYSLYFLFSVPTHAPYDPSVCLVQPILCSSSSLSPNFYPFFSPHFPCPTCLTLSMSLGVSALSFCPLLHPLVPPYFPFFTVSLLHALSLLLYRLGFLSVCLCLSAFLLSFSSSPSVCCSDVCHRHTHFTSNHFFQFFKLELLSLSMLFPRQVCMPRCCVPEASLKAHHAGTAEMC